MLFAVFVAATVKLIEFCVCTVPEQAVKIKRSANEVKKKDSSGNPANRVFVEGVIVTVDEVKKMASCTNGCGETFRNGAELVPVAGPAMVAAGQLTYCNHCDSFKNAA